MFYTQQKYYHTNCGYLILPGLPGEEEYVQKVNKSSENGQNHFLRIKNELNVKINQQIIQNTPSWFEIRLLREHE